MIIIAASLAVMALVQVYDRVMQFLNNRKYMEGINPVPVQLSPVETKVDEFYTELIEAIRSMRKDKDGGENWK